MRDPAHDIDVLNDLIEVMVDSYHSYREAAEQSKDAALADSFSQRALDCRSQLCNLRHAVDDLGGRPVLDGTTTGSARRIVMDLRAHLSTGDAALIEEVERSEDRLAQKFELALESYKANTPIRAIIEEAYLAAKRTHNTSHDVARAHLNQQQT